MSATRKLVIVTRSTQLEELIVRFNTREQARFYIEHNGGDFGVYEAAHQAYYRSLDRIRSSLPRGARAQWIERSFLPTFTFGEDDVVMVVGQDGLVVNTAKYLDGQPLIAVNPDPARIDGVLLPFNVETASVGLRMCVDGAGPEACHNVTMAEAVLNDGQTLLAVNDLFVGQRTHVSARYRITFGGLSEDQSSSGILVSTGAGSTGWLRSVYTGAAGVALAQGLQHAAELKDQYRFDWEARQLVFSVREPFVSRTSSAEVIFGMIGEDERLELESRMPRNGVIFSDGVEEDFLEFNSGTLATIGLAQRCLRLVRAPDAPRHGARTTIDGSRTLR